MPSGDLSAVSASVTDAVAEHQATLAPSEMDLERPVRVRVSRDGGRRAVEPTRVGSQAADAMAATKAQKAQERAAVKRAAAKRAAAKRAAAARAAEARRWHLPVASGSFRLTAQFGQCSALWSQCHTGLDFAAPSGTPIRSVAAGTVVETAYSGAYGNRTIIRLTDGTEIWYCHQTAFVVSAGQHVKAGQKIGTVGSTGNSTGPHLHLEVHPGGGDAVDPYSTLHAKGVRF